MSPTWAELGRLAAHHDRQREGLAAAREVGGEVQELGAHVSLAPALDAL